MANKTNMRALLSMASPKQKKVLFSSCSCLSALLCPTFMLLAICTLQMHSVIEDICERTHKSIDLTCQVYNLRLFFSDVKCDEDLKDTCTHDVSIPLAGSGLSPSIFGANDWELDRQPGIKRTEDDDADDWRAILQPGDPCSMHIPKGGTHARVDCPCHGALTRIQLMFQQYKDQDVKDTLEKERPCVVVTWPYETLFMTAPCLYIPSNGGLHSEIRLATTREKETARCKYSTGLFSSSGHYFVIFLLLCLFFCVDGLISCIGLFHLRLQAGESFLANSYDANDSMFDEEAHKQAMEKQQKQELEVFTIGFSEEQESPKHGEAEVSGSEPDREQMAVTDLPDEDIARHEHNAAVI